MESLIEQLKPKAIAALHVFAATFGTVFVGLLALSLKDHTFIFTTDFIVSLVVSAGSAAAHAVIVPLAEKYAPPALGGKR